jgi:hypothetical protein
MLSRQEEDRERRETLLNDQRVRRQQEQTGSTFHQHAQADVAMPRGRFAAVTTATVVGADPITNYPAAASHQHDPCGQEPSLGYRINDLNPSDLEPSALPEAQGTGEPTDGAPSPTLGHDVEQRDVGSSLSSPTYRRF